MAKMKYTAFREVVNSIPDCEDFEHFVAERGWQEWMEDYADGDNSDRIVKVLAAIWELRENPVKGIKKVVHTTNLALSEAYGIPIRTVNDWTRGAMASRSNYPWIMLAYCVFSDYGVI